METAIKILSDEHQNILKVINALSRECDSLTSGREIDENFFDKIIDFIRNYADKFHHAKEEDILFKEFNKCAGEGRAHCNPVEQMLREHDWGRSFVKKLEEGVGEKNKEKIIENARGYAQLLQEHIFKEDNILYPMADETFSPEAKNEMLEKFKQIGQNSAEENNNHLAFIGELENRKL